MTVVDHCTCTYGLLNCYSGKVDALCIKINIKWSTPVQHFAGLGFRGIVLAPFSGCRILLPSMYSARETLKRYGVYRNVLETNQVLHCSLLLLFSFISYKKKKNQKKKSQKWIWFGSLILNEAPLLQLYTFLKRTKTTFSPVEIVRKSVQRHSSHVFMLRYILWTICQPPINQNLHWSKLYERYYQPCPIHLGTTKRLFLQISVF